MREFVMGDIHGACKALKQCLQMSVFNYKKDRLIQLGDIVDRNDEVFECVEELLKIKNLIVVRGNQDDFEFSGQLTPERIPAMHRAFFERLPLYHVDAKGRCFVHGGFNRFHPFNGQPPSTYYWDRELWTAALEWQVNERLKPGQPSFHIKTPFNEIFIGHTPTMEWNITVPMRAAHIYNLDTSAGRGGRAEEVDLS
jgi:serine/threonine protein phosphatase 1